VRVLLSAILFFALLSCETERTLNLTLVSEDIVLTDSFSQIQVMGDLNLILQQDTAKHITKTTYQGFTNSIQAQVTGTTLFLESDPYVLSDALQLVNIFGHKPVRIQSNDNAKVSGVLTSSQLYLSHNSIRSMDLFVLNYATEAYVNSSGFLKMTGGGEILSLIVNGPAEVNTVYYDAETVKVVHNSSNNVYIRAEDFLTVEINGSGNVYYSGFPTIDATINGSGQLIQYFP
jgi:hypothetical protein